MIKTKKLLPTCNVVVIFTGMRKLKGDLVFSFEIEKDGMKISTTKSPETCETIITELGGTLENWNPKDFVGKKFIALIVPNEQTQTNQIVRLRPQPAKIEIKDDGRNLSSLQQVENKENENG